MPPPARTATPAVTAGMLVLSGASVSLPVYGAIRWILSATADVPFESAVATFVEGYPAWLPSSTPITLGISPRAVWLRWPPVSAHNSMSDEHDGWRVACSPSRRFWELGMPSP